MTPEARTAALRQLAAGLEGIDAEVYAAAGRDPLEPVIGAGDPACRIAVFGRDPGRHEVVHQQPFVGAGGQKVREALWRAVHGGALPGFEASLEVGRYVFWANTVPYKPIGNKVWPQRVRDAFRPYVTDLLVHGWQGREVLALGREALLWFGWDKARKARIEAHWAREDRFETSLEVDLIAPDGAVAVFRLHPLPHPSPLNATWGPRLPGLLDARLRALGLSSTSWQVDQV
jgi:uracil-DNA glycosylase